MRILVTGAGGFIGSHLAQALGQRGHWVIGIDNFTTGRRDNWDGCAYGDVAERHWRERLARVDVIAHCAASYKDPGNWEEDARTNVQGAIQVCRAVPDRIVYFQTALCYGHNPYGTRLPTPLSTAHRLAPDNSYAISKTAAELYIANAGIPYVSLRLANMYGPRNLSGPIPTFYKRISEGKSCTVTRSHRDFVYIGDLLPVAVAAVEGQGEGVYHVASGTDIDIETVFHEVAGAMGEPDAEHVVIDRPDGDSPSILLNPRLTELEFDWKVRTPLKVGVTAAVEWYQDRGVERTFTHLQEVLR